MPSSDFHECSGRFNFLFPVQNKLKKRIYKMYVCSHICHNGDKHCLIMCCRSSLPGPLRNYNSKIPPRLTISPRACITARHAQSSVYSLNTHAQFRCNMLIFICVPGSRTIRNAEYFDKEMNEWHDINNINVNRSAFQACVLSDIPNITDYTFHGQHRG